MFDSDLRQASIYGTEISEIQLKKCQRLGMLESPWLKSNWFCLASASALSNKEVHLMEQN